MSRRGSFLPPAKLAVIHKAVIKACDALDGVNDGVIEDPSRCHFDPGVLKCEGADAAACLTSAQMESARKLYGPVVNSAGTKIFPGFSPGSEMGWDLLAGAEPIADPVGAFKYVVFHKSGLGLDHFELRWRRGRA